MPPLVQQVHNQVAAGLLLDGVVLEGGDHGGAVRPIGDLAGNRDLLAVAELKQALEVAAFHVVGGEQLGHLVVGIFHPGLEVHGNAAAADFAVFHVVFWVRLGIGCQVHGDLPRIGALVDGGQVRCGVDGELRLIGAGTGAHSGEAGVLAFDRRGALGVAEQAHLHRPAGVFQLGGAVVVQGEPQHPLAVLLLDCLKGGDAQVGDVEVDSAGAGSAGLGCAGRSPGGGTAAKGGCDGVVRIGQDAVARCRFHHGVICGDSGAFAGLDGHMGLLAFAAHLEVNAGDGLGAQVGDGGVHRDRGAHGQGLVIGDRHFRDDSVGVATGDGNQVGLAVLDGHFCQFSCGIGVV